MMENVGSTRKVSELDDLALSRLIAKDFGLLKGPTHIEGKWRNVEDGTMTEITFPNFVTDPAMRDLLQQKLLEEGWRVYVRKESSGVFWIALTHITAGQNESFDIECATRERLWSEAYALAHGLGEE